MHAYGRLTCKKPYGRNKAIYLRDRDVFLRQDERCGSNYFWPLTEDAGHFFSDVSVPRERNGRELHHIGPTPHIIQLAKHGYGQTLGLGA